MLGHSSGIEDAEDSTSRASGVEKIVDYFGLRKNWNLEQNVASTRLRPIATHYDMQSESLVA